MFYEEIFISAYSGFTDTQCLAATITNYKKCSGLKQHKFIMLHFWKSEDQNQSQGARITELEYRYLNGGGGGRGGYSAHHNGNHQSFMNWVFFLQKFVTYLSNNFSVPFLVSA